MSWNKKEYFSRSNKKEHKRLKELKKQLNELKKLNETDLLQRVTK